MESRPRSKYMFCAVCKEHYQDYLGHISCRRHQRNYHSNKFTLDIVSLELTLNTGLFKEQKQRTALRNQQKQLTQVQVARTGQPSTRTTPY